MNLKYTDLETGKEYQLTDFLRAIVNLKSYCDACEGTGYNEFECTQCKGNGYRTGQELLDEAQEARVAQKARAK